MTPCPGAQESESESMVLSEDIVCKHILHVAAGSLHATASAAQEHLQNNNSFFLLLQCSSWEPSPGILKEEALEFVLWRFPAAWNRTSFFEKFQRPILTEENVQSDTNGSGAI